MSATPEEGRSLYRNTRFRRVRAVQYGLWLAALGFALAASVLPFLSPGAELRALVILAPILAVCACGMEIYRGLYVTAILARPEGLVVETLAWRGRRHALLPWPALPRLQAPRRYRTRGAVSSAVMLRRPGARLPYIVDTTVDALDTAGLRRFSVAR